MITPCLIPSQTRRGIALALALMMAILVISVVFITTEGAASTAQQVDRLAKNSDAAFAVETVLLRRERDILRLANIGDSVNFSTWSTGNAADRLGQTNYGVDQVGGFDVLWKIEPTRTAPSAYDATGSVVAIENVFNPAPDAAIELAPDEAAERARARSLENGTMFLFRVVAEARDLAPIPSASGVQQDGQRRAQGVRIVSVSGEPLLREVLAWVSKGPKGDLELSHGDGVQIAGNILSNGAIYVGGGLKVNDQLAQLGSVNAGLLPTATQMGPGFHPTTFADAPVQVRGFDGVFRLSKPLMFALVNGFPLTNTSIPSLGAPSGNWTAGGTFDTGAGYFPDQETAGSLEGLTSNGTIINPYRIRDGSGAVTRGPSDTNIPPAPRPGVAVRPADLTGRSARTVNQVPLTSTNDARDARRTDDAKWAQTAETDFENHIKTRQNGALIKPLNAEQSNRPAEPQTLAYVEHDGRIDTDEHEYARPQFINATGGATSLMELRGVERRLVENPGVYVRQAVADGNAAMVRRRGGEGWDIRNKMDPNDNVVPGGTMGLMIRERQVPHVGYWPGTTDAGVLVASTHPRYVPYAYGKQWYPNLMPFASIDVSDNFMRTWRYNGGFPSVTTNYALSQAIRTSSYLGGGRLQFSGATNPGVGFSTAEGGYLGQWNSYGGFSEGGIQRKLHYYRDAWNFIHLGKYLPNERLTGLRIFLYRDQAGLSQTENTYRDQIRNMASPLPCAMGGPEVDSSGTLLPTYYTVTDPSNGIVGSVAGTLQWPTATNLPLTGFWTARWVGFVRAPSTGIYSFASSTSNNPNAVVRLWVNNEWRWESGTTWTAIYGGVSQTPAPVLPTTPLSLTAGRFYPVVIDYSLATGGGVPASGPTLLWSINGGAATPLPAESLFPPHTEVTAPGLPAPVIPVGNFLAVQMRIDNPQSFGTSNAAHKLGIMVRPEQAITPLQQGGGAYATIAWNEQRGFFTQRRALPVRQSQRNIGTYFIGDGFDSSGLAANVHGEIPENSLSQPGVQRTATMSTVFTTPVVQRNSADGAFPATNIVDGSFAWVDEPRWVAPAPILQGGGGVIDVFPSGMSIGVGPVVARREVQSQTRSRYWHESMQTIQATGSQENFRSTDRGALAFFQNPVGTALSAGGANIIAFTPLTDFAGWWVSNGVGVSTASDSPFLSRRQRSPTWTSPPSYGLAVPQTAPMGDAGTLWAENGTIRVQVGSQFINVTTDTLGEIFLGTTHEAYLIALLNGAVADITQILPLSGGRPSTWPDLPALPAASAPSGPGPGDVPPLVLPEIDGNTFSLIRSETNIWFDQHPWINTTATWLGTPLPQFLPRAGSWPAAWLSVPGGVWPLTGGMRPDVWGRGGFSAWGYGSTPTSGTSGLVVDAIGGITTAGTTTGGNGYTMADDFRPAGFTNAATKEVWVRIERDPGTNQLRFLAYAGSARPGPSDWRVVGNPLDISGWGPSLLVGPCLAGASASTRVMANVSNLQIETTLPAPNNLIDGDDWDHASTGGVDEMARYLMSQYQVFFGATDITEHFFSWADPILHRRNASEDWFFQTREFWSQSRWWDHLSGAGNRVEKDPFAATSSTFANTNVRQLLAKTTLLSLDLEVIQGYLRAHLLGDAAVDVVSGPSVYAGGPAELPPQPFADDSRTMAAAFNGLIYAIRTNRYPWNPAVHPSLAGDATERGINPYSPHTDAAMRLPNSELPSATGDPRIVNGTTIATMTGDSRDSMLHLGIHKLDPYGLAPAPAIQPQNFHHGIRLINGQKIDLGMPTTGFSGPTTDPQGDLANGMDWRYTEAPQFGDRQAKLTVVTPNLLYVQGSLNVHRHLCRVSGLPAPVYKYPPMAIAGDQITLLSNAWLDLNYQITGLSTTNTVPGYSGAGILAKTQGMPASSTWYHAAIITNSSPTTRDRVLEGQASPFIDTTRFLENWTSTNMTYLGSVQVLDSRRYTKSFLLDAFKVYGTTPFGISASADASSQWRNFWQLERGTNLPIPSFPPQPGPLPANGGSWRGRVPIVFSEPTRSFRFNEDFKTSDGTPPFVPFAVSASGVGSWIRVYN